MMWRRKPRLSYIGKFVRELRSGDVDAFLTRLKAFFADFPYELKAKTEDAVVKTKDYIYVFEFKLDGSVKDALRQIDEKGYLLPYEADGRELVKIGVSFSKEDRNLGCWEIV